MCLAQHAVPNGKHAGLQAPPVNIVHLHAPCATCLQAVRQSPLRMTGLHLRALHKGMTWSLLPRLRAALPMQAQQALRAAALMADPSQILTLPG